jgi:hypothetical protein
MHRASWFRGIVVQRHGILVLWVGALATGCTRPQNGTQPSAEIASNVHVIGDSLTVNATMTPTSMTLPLAGHDELARLAPGDLVASGSGHGFLRRIQKVTPAADGTIVFQTAPAALADAIVNGSARLQINGGNGKALGPLPSPQQALAIQIDLKNQTIFDDGTVRVAVDDLSYSFTPSIDLGFTIANHSVQEFHDILSGTSKVSATASLSASGAAQRQANVTLFQQDYTFVQLIAGFPVVEVVTFTLTGKLDANVSGAGKVTETITDTENDRIGAQYQSGTWTPIADRASVFDIAPPVVRTASATAKVGLSLEGRVDVKFYGVAGPFLSLELYNNDSLSYDATKDPCAVSYDLALGIDSHVGVELDVPLGLIQPISFSTTLFDVILADKMGTVSLRKSSCQKACDGGATTAGSDDDDDGDGDND